MLFYLFFEKAAFSVWRHCVRLNCNYGTKIRKIDRDKILDILETVRAVKII